MKGFERHTFYLYQLSQLAMRLRLKAKSETESNSAEGSKAFRNIADALVKQAVYMGTVF